MNFKLIATGIILIIISVGLFIAEADLISSDMETNGFLNAKTVYQSETSGISTCILAINRASIQQNFDSDKLTASSIFDGQNGYISHHIRDRPIVVNPALCCAFQNGGESNEIQAPYRDATVSSWLSGRMITELKPAGMAFNVNGTGLTQVNANGPETTTKLTSIGKQTGIFSLIWEE